MINSLDPKGTSIYTHIQCSMVQSQIAVNNSLINGYMLNSNQLQTIYIEGNAYQGAYVEANLSDHLVTSKKLPLVKGENGLCFVIFKKCITRR